jgi:type IV pilus assembly protein PilP
MISAGQVTVKMDKRLKICINAVILILFGCSLLACGKEEPPASQPQAVSKKITVDSQPKSAPAQAQPTKTATAKPSAAPDSVTGKPPEAPAGDEAAAGKPGDKQEPSELIQASMEIASTYDPEGKIDPFEPLFKEEPEPPQMEAFDEKRKKRTPQTPLERVALSQIKLSAIMRSSAGNRALVEDATGKGYVIKKGTYIGLNAGQVKQIEKDRVIIEEEIENLMGELIVKDTELKLQKPAGEI